MNKKRLFQIINCNLEAGEIIKNEDSYNMLKDVISDLWCCISTDKFADFLYHHRGMESQEINKYIELIDKIYYNQM